MSRDTSNETSGEKKARDVAETLDKTTEPLGGTSQIHSHAQVGYTEEDVERRAGDAAAQEGVSLYRNPDGSHTAIDESAAEEFVSKDHARSADESADDEQ